MEMTSCRYDGCRSSAQWSWVNSGVSISAADVRTADVYRTESTGMICKQMEESKAGYKEADWVSFG